MSTAWKYGNWIAGSWDKLQRGRHILIGIEEWIFRERSEFQEVAIATVPDYGHGLFLDAVVEFLALDEFVYHESFALPPLLFHPSPKRVLIAGGGDGLALREVLRDPRVDEVVMVELDGLVIDACKAHLPELHRGSFDDNRATILIQDIFPYLESDPQPFDVILVDLLDAYDQLAVGLYDKVLRLLRDALTPAGIVGAFGDVAPPHMAIRVPYRGLKRVFENVAMHQAPLTAFGGGYGFLLASNSVAFDGTAAELIADRASALTGDLRALVPEHFPHCFAMPRHIRDGLDALDEESAPPTEGVTDAFSWIYPDESR
jgi:spermidine synthase